MGQGITIFEEDRTVDMLTRVWSRTTRLRHLFLILRTLDTYTLSLSSQYCDGRVTATRKYRQRRSGGSSHSSGSPGGGRKSIDVSCSEAAAGGRASGWGRSETSRRRRCRTTLKREEVPRNPRNRREELRRRRESRFGGVREPESEEERRDEESKIELGDKFDDGAEGDEKFSGREDDEEEYRDFDPEGSESLLKEQSPVHSVDNVALDLWHGHRRPVRARVSESREHDAVELDAMPDSDSRDRKCRTSADRNLTANRLLDDGVRTWLFGLGLGRYAPVFEIHEVDFEVLPLLTLEDLKDMGINAVGSRRKIYTAIQNLRKGFT
ncbi:hypothetical protein CK203_040519 [Vitis vinifera]|uniref:SAM domain-containing protein n=1 Tax=Vitis vinifera TaxID=29760 RepID=A0A438HHX9_VITVI|nr:hypothetical protein CK203_040519 [Vitis vinifera]